MIERAARHLAIRIKNADPDHTASPAVLEYALTILINMSLIAGVTLLVGWWTGKPAPAAEALLDFALLRLFSGGFHFRSSAACSAATILLCAAIPFLAPWAEVHPAAIHLLCLILLLLFAPRLDHRTAMPKTFYPLLKCLSLAVVAANFFFQSPVAELAFLAQCLTILPLGRR